MNIDVREPTNAQYSINFNVQIRDFDGIMDQILGLWTINVKSLRIITIEHHPKRWHIYK